MFGPRLSRVFASRWMALWWAASVLLLVWQFVPRGDDPAAKARPDPVVAARVAANPWMLDRATDPARGAE